MERKYIAELIWATTKYGALSRSRIYNQDIDSLPFRKFIRNFLKAELLDKYYGRSINEQRLLVIIEKLEKQANQFEEIESFSFGNAQKFINLYLKGMWTIGILTKEPPHVPIDSKVIRWIGVSAKRCNPLNRLPTWTSINMVQYKCLISLLKAKVESERKYASIAEWELQEYYEDVYS